MVWDVNGYEKDAEPETSAAQMTPPFVSVVSLPLLPKPEQPPAPRFVNVRPLTLMPEAKVEVAVVVEILRRLTLRPPSKVEVALVDEEKKTPPLSHMDEVVAAVDVPKFVAKAKSGLLPASSLSQSPDDPVISTQFAVRRPEVLSRPFPSSEVKRSELILNEFAISRSVVVALFARRPDANRLVEVALVVVPRVAVYPPVSARRPVASSAASDLKKDPESIESNVVASVQLEVTAMSLALTVIQVPAPTARAPEVVVSPPPSREEYEVLFNMRFPPVIVRPFEEARPPVYIPPTKVEVAVEVALIEATYGVVDETTLPRLFVARRVEGLTLDKFKVVPESNVNVPEVKESEVSDRRNERESMPSSVWAFEETQVPLTS